MGKLFVVGIGPGDPCYMTEEARCALASSDVFVGYDLYVEQVKDLFPGTETVTTPMKHETERCRKALAMAQAGRTVSLVCSGDAGVYGMASPVLMLLPEYEGVTVQVVAGVTAALSGAARLGAPLGHDFCVISLSDLLTPWEIIEKRLRSAAEADLVIALYNPSSKKRADYLARACDILLETKRGDTPCGIAHNIGRAGEEARLLTLAELRETAVDMFTTVFVGSGATRVVGGKLVTPRGYRV